MVQRKTFPRGGRWHGEAVTDEGKRGDFLGDNEKKGKITDMVLLFPTTEPFGASAPHPPQCALWGTFPPGEGIVPSSIQTPIYRADEENRYVHIIMESTSRVGGAFG